ncbi:hypothetical protein F511_19545 [Dorcoceras hygrometricum]|uniref:Uncharacterized protein n=1 Tax=Dorcoceras hygrometricum TaxID=472368 RepID=A0A2Z7D5X1_9LAMI|nr:hypothetical protein F511_19545 [Dorcoceras hygrometricum]
MNQIEMGLRFPIPTFIAAFCRHIQLSPSQLAPNSYSFLLALAVLLSYHEIPLIPYVLMQLVQIKRLGPGKFYLSHKGDHTFIKGNPSTHKGWMSRFFYIKCDVMRDPWRCEMNWRDSTVTLCPRTPDRAPSLIPFLEAMHDDRMGKAELLKAMQEAVAAPSKKTTKKSKAPSMVEKEARGEKRKKAGASTSGESKAPSMVEKEARGEKRKKAGASTSGARTEETSKQKQEPTPPTPSSEGPLDDSLVESPSAIAATGYICNMAPDRDLRALRKARNADVVGHFSTNLAAAVAWGGELVKRLTQTYQKMNASREQFDRAMGQHTEMLERLEEEAHEAEKTARELLEAELEEVKAQARQEAERLKIESREEFLKSPEFDTLLGKKAGGYFKNGFRGCLAQWRANGYSEEEHPTSFLDVQQAIIEMADEEEEVEEEEEDEEEGDGGVATRGGVSAELGLSAERVGLMCLHRRATRICQCETGLCCSGGVATRRGASAELGFGAELVGLMCLRRRATRICQCGTGLCFSGGVATRGGASAQLGFGAELVGLMCSDRVVTQGA